MALSPTSHLSTSAQYLFNVLRSTGFASRDTLKAVLTGHDYDLSGLDRDLLSLRRAGKLVSTPASFTRVGKGESPQVELYSTSCALSGTSGPARPRTFSQASRIETKSHCLSEMTFDYSGLL